MPLRDALLALLVVFIWGTSFLAIRFGVDEVPPLMLTALRFFFTAIPGIFLRPRPAVSSAWTLPAYGIALAVGLFGCVFSAIKLGMPTGLTSTVVQMQVFFTMGIAVIALGERASRLQVAGALVAFGGVALFMVERAEGAPLGPFLLVLVGAGFWGTANIIGKKAAPRDGIGFVLWSSLYAPAPLVVLSYFLEDWSHLGAVLVAPSLTLVLSVAYLTLAANILAFWLWSGLLARHPVASVAPFALLIPVVGFACGILVLGERVTAMTVLGTGIVLSGLAINVFGDRLVAALRPREGASTR